MPGPNDTTLTSFKDWTLRVRESGAPNPRLLLLIHGLTGDENSMWVFARNLPARYWLVAPRAPHAAETGGYSWRLPNTDGYDRLSLDMMRANAEAVIRLVDEYAASVGIDAQTFDVMGFSQGAAVSSTLAFLFPERIRKAGLLAGFVPDGLDELVSQRPLEGRNIFVAHGSQDETVTIDRARTSIEKLEKAGAQVTFCEDEVGHKVSLNCLRALQNYFAD